MAKTLLIRCPDCGALLRLDAHSGVVISHDRPERKPQVDLDHAADRLRQEESQRNRRFEASVVAERNRDQLLGQKFEEALRRAREDPDSPPPPRDIDLD